MENINQIYFKQFWQFSRWTQNFEILNFAIISLWFYPLNSLRNVVFHKQRLVIEFKILKYKTFILRQSVQWPTQSWDLLITFSTSHSENYTQLSVYLYIMHSYIFMYCYAVAVIIWNYEYCSESVRTYLGAYTAALIMMACVFICSTRRVDIRQRQSFNASTWVVIFHLVVCKLYL